MANETSGTASAADRLVGAAESHRRAGRYLSSSGRRLLAAHVAMVAEAWGGARRAGGSRAGGPQGSMRTPSKNGAFGNHIRRGACLPLIIRITINVSGTSARVVCFR